MTPLHNHRTSIKTNEQKKPLNARLSPRLRPAVLKTVVHMEPTNDAFAEAALGCLLGDPNPELRGRLERIRTYADTTKPS